jgi:hypothetical protein
MSWVEYQCRCVFRPPATPNLTRVLKDTAHATVASPPSRHGLELSFVFHPFSTRNVVLCSAVAQHLSGIHSLSIRMVYV